LNKDPLNNKLQSWQVATRLVLCHYLNMTNIIVIFLSKYLYEN